jgi:hypothetical protein
MVERLSPLAFNRIAELDHFVRIMEPTGTLDAFGGFIEGPPRLVAQVWAAIEPTILSRLVKETLSGGAIANSESYHVTMWYLPGVTVSQYLEFDDTAYPPPPLGFPTFVTRRLDITEIRQVKQANRYYEMLCKERVPPPPQPWTQAEWMQEGWAI